MPKVETIVLVFDLKDKEDAAFYEKITQYEVSDATIDYKDGKYILVSVIFNSGEIYKAHVTLLSIE